MMSGCCWAAGGRNASHMFVSKQADEQAKVARMESISGALLQH